jgi:P-type Mg2+ transporter
MDSFWAQTPKDVMDQLKSRAEGLSASEASQRLAEHGLNILGKKGHRGALVLLLSQFKSPIILILFFAILLSFYLGDTTDALIILVIVLFSGLLGFWQEYGANAATEKLFAIVEVKTTILRDGQPIELGVDQVVPGDVISLSAGDIIPADGLIISSNALFADESTLTGETYPAEKESAPLPAEIALSQRRNSLWMGTHIISGTASFIVVHTGKDTEFGAISEHLKHRPQATEFERGIRRFGNLLMEITLLLVFTIFAINVFFHRPVLDSFMFSLALAVGLTPQLLPAIISINLSHGAKTMAKQKSIVKRLSSIENFGSMDILCSDKTGTLTAGTVEIQAALDIDGGSSERVFLYAYLNSSFESGFVNPIDQAIRGYRKIDISNYRKLDEEPYDFTRKRLSVLVEKMNGESAGPGGYIMVTKGALKNVLSCCTQAESADGRIVSISDVRDSIDKQFEEYSAKGHRTLGIAYKDNGNDPRIKPDHETGMTFLGFITLYDPLKPDIKETIDRLNKLGISLKVITGDNRLVALNVMKQLDIPESMLMTGPDLHNVSDRALVQKASGISVFAEVEPNQKDRIIIALKEAGHVVGYLGDGINDVSALHDADVGISVNSAVDAAKEAADIVLLEHDLAVLVQGVISGRTTFANTMKYIFMATSANFGNMFSMAGASLFLPFLPLLPKQILLTNLLTDFPEMTIATDRVDESMINRPRRWNIGFIRKFMFTFGLISSLFDYLTFGALILIKNASQTQFRTGWFTESIISAALIVLVIRTRSPLLKSPPSLNLLLATLAVIAATIILPYTPLAALLGFEPLAWASQLMILAIIGLYIVAAEAAKRVFYKIVKY